MAQCQATVRKTGEQCRRRAVSGYRVCTVHGAGCPSRVKRGEKKPPGRPIEHGHKSKYFKQEVLNKIESFSKDVDIEKLDFEIGYLKSLLPRIEDLTNDDIDAAGKIALLEKVLTSVFKNMDAREKIIDQRRYSIGLDKLKLLIKYMFEAVRRHVDDEDILRKIGAELREIATKTGDGTGELLK